MFIEPFPTADTLYIHVDAHVVVEYRMGIVQALEKTVRMKNAQLRQQLLSKPPETLQDKEAREKVKVEHKQGYMTTYRQKYKESKVRVNITLSREQYDRVKQSAQMDGRRVTSFVKDTLLQEVDKVYLLPEDEKVENLILQIRAIGNNINQLTRHIHRSGLISPGDISQLRENLVKIESAVETKLSQPPDLLGLVGKEVGSNPQFLAQLAALVSQHQNQHEKQ